LNFVVVVVAVDDDNLSYTQSILYIKMNKITLFFLFYIPPNMFFMPSRCLPIPHVEDHHINQYVRNGVCQFYELHKCMRKTLTESQYSVKEYAALLQFLLGSLPRQYGRVMGEISYGHRQCSLQFQIPPAFIAAVLSR
jgi:hypothetical protein